jgi:hypothetical protein
MQDSRNKNDRNEDRQRDDLSKRNNQQNTSTRDLSADNSLQKDTEENDRLKAHEPDNYERDAE